MSHPTGQDNCRQPVILIVAEQRRLLPALFFTQLVCFVFALLLFTPQHFRDFGFSLLSSTFSLSNVYFFSEVGYFNLGIDDKPLLHTWSLSVEEQFYFIWPATLVFLLAEVKKYKFVDRSLSANVKNRWFFHKNLPIFLPIGFLFFISLISLYLSEQYLSVDPYAVFYLLPFRLLEFAMGAICVWGISFKPSNKFLTEFISIVGMLLIIWSVVTYSDKTVFPGFAAIVPCFGAMLIIFVGPTRHVGLFLTNFITVSLGRISYSLYLVHWPILVFYSYWRFTPLSEFERIILLVVMVVIAFLMWKFVENRFRYSKKPVLLSYGLIQLVTCLAVIIFVLSIHSTWRWWILERGNMDYKQVMLERNRYWDNLNGWKNGYTEPERNSETVLVLGNSHAMDLIYAFKENGDDRNFYRLNTRHNCYNFGTSMTKGDGCEEIRKRNFSQKIWQEADVIFLHDNWLKKDISDLEDRLNEIRLLTGKPIYVFGPKMTFSRSVPLIVYHSRIKSPNEFGIQFQNDIRFDWNQEFKRIVEKYNDKGIYYIDILSNQCPNKICDIVLEGTFEHYYFDDEHFTLIGAKNVGAKLKAVYPGIFGVKI